MLFEFKSRRAVPVPDRLPEFCAAALILLGLAALGGWAFAIPALRGDFVPGMATLKVNGALCFVGAGLAMAALPRPHSPWARRVVVAGAGLVALVAGLTLAEQLAGLDFGIDELLVRDPDTPPVLYPGRMATATAAGLFLAGPALIASLYAPRRPWLGGLARGLAYAVLGIGGIALVGYLINFNFLYTWHAFGSIAIHTALGLVVLGTGLWAVSRRPRKTGDDVRITRLATLLLAGVAGVTGIAVAAVLENEVERALNEGLRIGLDSHISQVEASIELRTTRAAIITNRILMLENLRKLIPNPGRAEYRAMVRKDLESFAPHGFAAIAVALPDGTEVARMGRFVVKPALTVRLAGPAKTVLLWKDGFYLRHRLPLGDAEGPLGTVIAEQPLPNLTRAVLETESFGRSVELVLCSPEARSGFVCFPSRLTPRPFAIAPLSGGPERLVQRAFAGGTGFGAAIDYRGRRVLGAYGPVGGLGLFAVLKIDAGELYGGIGSKFFRVLLLTAGLIAGGGLLMRVRVRPLATALEARVRDRTAEIAAANARLSESEERFRQVAEMSCQWIWEQDAGGRYLFSSPAVKEILGYEPEELIGRHYHEFLAGERGPERGAETGAAAGPEAFSGLINCYRHRDGHEVYTESTGAPIRDGQGRLVKWRGVDYDIGLLRAKQAAEAANRAKSEFLANMSHEIRTPINGIVGMTDLALDTELTPEQREYLTMARESADSLLRLVNDILDFSKIEAGKLDLEAIGFNLRDRLENVVKTLALRAHKQGLELVCHIPPEVPDRLVGDPGRLCQIVVNLVGNAIKFTERGEVVVDVAVESRTPAEAVLHVTVKDTGIGIPAEKQRSVFDAFAQADASTTRKYGGTGLGLAIASRLVDLMGGRIWLESEVGRGSIFHFTVRLGVEAGVPVQAPNRIPDIKDLPVLIVDDNGTNRRILEEMVAAWGMQPIAVDGGRAALREMERLAAEGAALPLVLLDAMMPEMDGFELAERIKQHPEFARAAIMMLSSAAQPGDPARCRALGMAAFLTKPVKQSDLLETILSALNRPKLSAPPDSPPRPAAGRRLRVLVAEDHPVNQRLAVRLLEKRGHAAVVAGNGKEALAALEKEDFDLVLMDVQMPEMDGFEATAAIRGREQGGKTHIPIVAMTAHAMKGDRERCLAAGMDAYLAKPLQRRELFELLETLFPGSAQGGAEAPAGPVFDRDYVLARVEGDEALLRELVGLFLEQTPRLLAEIRSAIDGRDAKALERAAHALKGSAGNFGAKSACDAALRLEMLGRGGDFGEAGAAYGELNAEMERLQAALAALRSS
jgi:PAS domain S-box-containing protein